MKEKIEKLLKATRKSRSDLAEKLGITYNGLQNKINNDTFKHNEIKIVEDFFEVEVGYFNVLESTNKKTQSVTENWKDKYFSSLEVINKLMLVINQNGIKVEGLGKFKGLPNLQGVFFGSNQTFFGTPQP